MEYILGIVLLLGSLIGQLDPNNCAFQFTCFPDNPLAVFEIYSTVYGVPNIVILGLVLGMIEGAIYLKNRSLTMLAILGIYTIAALGATAWNDPAISEQFDTVKYIIAFAIGTAILIMILKIVRE
jgi:uncharacterized membrane protein YeaQ/YmgE (transglycosylase-associated protein family)